jgi:DNA-binding GntR family transcriptional regulator
MPAGQVTTAARVPTTGNGRATRRRSSAASSEGSHAPWNQAIPRYRQLAAELIAAIESGQLRIGDELPSEYELCERYGVSRTTVREAFRLVELEGLISRQQGAVRKVLAKQLRGYTMSLGSEEETRQYAAENIVDYRPDKQGMSAKKAAELGIADPQMYRSASGLHWEQSESVQPAGLAPGRRPSRLPVAFTTVYIRHPYSDVVDSLHGPSSIVLFAPICASYGLALSHVDQTTTAMLIPPAIARRLDCEPGALGLRVTHRFYADQIGLFELTDEIYPADRYSLFHRFNVVSAAKGASGRTR